MSFRVVSQSEKRAIAMQQERAEACRSIAQQLRQSE
jgi:hypothetical protein